MGLEFLYLKEDENSIEFRNKLSIIRDQSKDLRNNDNQWVQIILSHINEFYRKQSTIDKESLLRKDERGIKEYIRQWFDNDEAFNDDLLDINLEPQNYSSHLGYYDIKIKSSLWNGYFVFECKCLNNTKHSILEYVYNPNKIKGKGSSKVIYSDGGVYRFLINKYAMNKPYGGMIGFVLNGDSVKIRAEIIQQLNGLRLAHGKQIYGHVTKLEIQNNLDHYFKSGHFRYDIAEDKICKDITLHHFLFDFCN